MLSTKVHARMSDDDPNAAGSSRRHIIDQCHASLRRLQTDHLDMYYLHRPTSAVPIDESLRALDDLVRAGKVRYIATSSFAAWQILESLWVSKELHLERMIAEQTPYSLVDRRVERELLPMAQSYGIGITVWSPLAGGLLTGKYSPGVPPPADTRLSQAWAANRFLSDDRLAATEALRGFAESRGHTLLELAVSWLLRQPVVSSVIAGATTPEQVKANASAASWRLTADELAAIDELAPAAPAA